MPVKPEEYHVELFVTERLPPEMVTTAAVVNCVTWLLAFTSAVIPLAGATDVNVTLVEGNMQAE